MNSGWAAKVDTDAFRGFDGEAMHYPGFHIDATNMLLEEPAPIQGQDLLIHQVTNGRYADGLDGSANAPFVTNLTG